MPTTQMYILYITSGRLWLNPSPGGVANVNFNSNYFAIGIGSLSVLRHDVLLDEGSIEAEEHSSLFCCLEHIELLGLIDVQINFSLFVKTAVLACNWFGEE